MKRIGKSVTENVNYIGPSVEPWGLPKDNEKQLCEEDGEKKVVRD